MASARNLVLEFSKHTKYTIHPSSLTQAHHPQCIRVSYCNSTQYRFSTWGRYNILEDSVDAHPIMSILTGCRSLKDCYERIRSADEYIALLNSDNSTYSYQHHKYFILTLIQTASKDKYLSHQMIINIIEFYSNKSFNSIYNVPTESIHNFLSILSRRGDFNAITSIIDRLTANENTDDNKLPTLSINNQLFCILIQSLRIGGQYDRGYALFEQALNEFKLKPSISLLLQGYMVCHLNLFLIF